jgi:NAD(P)-dependent dehydrogenase (short-subunit alcohol dehydrogenase family)
MYLEKFRLDGQVALISGGLRGLGLAIAEAFGEAGAHLVLTSRSPNSAVVDQLRAKGYSVAYHQADLMDPSAAAELVQAALAHNGRLDIQVNNAGIADHGPTHEFSDARLQETMGINFDAVFRCCRAALVPMIAQQSGVILNVGSVAGEVSLVPQPQAAYSASKAAVHMLTRSLASDYAKDNIRVNALAPGYIETDMTKGGLADPDMAPVWKAMTPMSRPGRPEEIGAAALYLCSAASSYVTGEVLGVNGGYTTR